MAGCSGAKGKEAVMSDAELAKAESKWLHAIRWQFLTTVINWLESTNDDRQWWKIHTNLIRLCISEMSAVVDGKEKAVSMRARVHDPTDPTIATLDRVIPHFNALWAAMQDKNRRAALACAKTAGEALEASIRSRPQLEFPMGEVSTATSWLTLSKLVLHCCSRRPLLSGSIDRS
jgi:hypothetical protein